MRVLDEVSGATRHDEDILVELGATGVIRQRAPRTGSDDGMGGIFALNYAEDGDVTVHLAEGSLIDLTPRGGSIGVRALLDPDADNAGAQTGDIVIRAAGTIRNAVKSRTPNRRQGTGIRAVNNGLGVVRIASSGTVESWQAVAIHAAASSADGEQHDDPATEEVEGHLIDVTAGKVHTRGGTAINAESYSADSAFTVRVGEGATVRAELDAGPDALTQAQFGTGGERYLYPGSVYGWRRVDTDGDGTDDALEPVVNAIRVAGGTTSEGVADRSEGVADRVVVHGRVEAVGGKADVDPAILMNDGGVVVVGATGRVVAEGSGLAIASGNAPPATPPEDYEAEASDLDVTVAGRVTGDILVRDDGDLRASVSGTVAGDVRARGGGTLDMSVAGQVAGDLRAPRGGTLKLSVREGGRVPGTVHDPAGSTMVAGRIGRLLYTNGGTVRVGGTGRLTGVEGVAVRNEAGGLVVDVAGEVTGDIRSLGAPPARVTTEPGSTVAGTIDVAGAGSELRVGGTLGQARFRRGGTMTVGPDGRISEKVTIDDRGELVAVAEVKRGETEVEALERAFPDEIVGGTLLVRTRKEGEPARSVGAPGTMAALVDGAWDVGVERTEGGVFRVARELAPRSRVYEALPSVVLGMNGLRGYGERMSAPRSAKGGWARVESYRGEWKADASTSGKETGTGLRYRHQRHGVEVGLGGALGEEGHFGASLHHRRGTARVTEGGDVELHGMGAGVSGTWMREGVYVDVQAAMTWYEADLRSSRRGVLRKDVSGLGHALGVEAGRRVALERLPAGVVLIPRAGLVHSQVSMDGFPDVTGARVRVDDARSLRGRVGVDVETKPGGAAGSRVFASVEVEHELSTERKVRVSGTELRSEAEATWLRLGLNGAYTWGEGRYTLAGGVGYATSGVAASSAAG